MTSCLERSGPPVRSSLTHLTEYPHHISHDPGGIKLFDTTGQVVNLTGCWYIAVAVNNPDMILKKVVKRRNKDKTMIRILLAAKEAIAKGGVSKAGVNAIAKQAGANKVLLYRYFNGWNGLIEALYEYMLTAIHEQVATSTTPNRIDTYAVQYYQELGSNVALQVLIRWQMDNKPTELGQRLGALHSQFLQQIASSAGVEAGLTRLLMAGITHSILTEDKQNPDEAMDLSETTIRQFSEKLMGNI